MIEYDKNFPENFGESLEVLDAALQDLKVKHVSALFWTASAWASIINLSQKDPSILVSLSKVELMMRRVLELDSDYYFGSVYLFYGSYYSSLPTFLGGNLTKAKDHIQKAIQITQGKYLLPKFFFAIYYALPSKNKELFVQTLKEIIDTPFNIWPEQGLANALTISRAKTWLKKADELFTKAP